MSHTAVRRVLDRLPHAGNRRAELSVAAYRTVFGIDRDVNEKRAS